MNSEVSETALKAVTQVRCCYGEMVISVCCLKGNMRIKTQGNRGRCSDRDKETGGARKQE